MKPDNKTRFLINPNKASPYDTIGVDDWVVFGCGDGDCEIGQIINFYPETHKYIVAQIMLPNGVIRIRNVFRDIEKGYMFKVDHYCAKNIKIIKEDK